MASSRSEAAGRALGESIVEAVNLMYQNNTAANYLRGLIRILEEDYIGRAEDVTGGRREPLYIPAALDRIVSACYEEVGESFPGGWTERLRGKKYARKHSDDTLLLLLEEIRRELLAARGEANR